MRRLGRTGRRLGLTLGVVLLAGCSGGGKPKPQPLEPLTPRIARGVAWTQRIESVSFPLTVSVAKGAYTLAADNGTVVSLDAMTGAERWRASAGGPISAGVGSDGRYAAVVTRAGDLVVFEEGQLKWRKALGARVSTAPLVAGERVFVLGVDRAVQAFDAADGRKLWALQRPGDALTLAQSGVLAAFRNTLIAGQGPRMAGIEPTQGTVKWETPIGQPRGANEIERLADLVGPPVRVGNAMCARSYQAAVGCVDADSGVVQWTKTVGGTDPIAGDAELIFGADASDRLTAWKTPSGEVAWTSDKLQYRSVGAPAAFGNSVVYGDEGGTLHWFARDSGEAQLRVPTDGSPIVVPPVVSGGLMLVVTRKGGVYAFRQ